MGSCSTGAFWSPLRCGIEAIAVEHTVAGRPTGVIWSGAVGPLDQCVRRQARIERLAGGSRRPPAGLPGRADRAGRHRGLIQWMCCGPVCRPEADDRDRAISTRFPVGPGRAASSPCGSCGEREHHLVPTWSRRWCARSESSPCRGHLRNEALGRTPQLVPATPPSAPDVVDVGVLDHRGQGVLGVRVANSYRTCASQSRASALGRGEGGWTRRHGTGVRKVVKRRHCPGCSGLTPRGGAAILPSCSRRRPQPALPRRAHPQGVARPARAGGAAARVYDLALLGHQRQLQPDAPLFVTSREARTLRPALTPGNVDRRCRRR